MKLLGKWRTAPTMASKDQIHHDDDGMTKSTVTAASKRPSHSRQNSKRSHLSDREPSSSRRAESHSHRDSSRSMRSPGGASRASSRGGSVSRASSRGRSVERTPHSSSDRARGSSAASHDRSKRHRPVNSEASRASSSRASSHDGRSRTTSSSRDRSSSRRRSSSQSSVERTPHSSSDRARRSSVASNDRSKCHRPVSSEASWASSHDGRSRTTSSSRDRSSSRRRASSQSSHYSTRDGRSSTRSAPPSTAPSRGRADSTTTRSTSTSSSKIPESRATTPGKVTRQSSHESPAALPGQSTSRGRGVRSSDISTGSRTDRTTSSKSAKIGNRSVSSQRSRRKSMDSKSDPLLGGDSDGVIMVEQRKERDLHDIPLARIESDIEQGTAYTKASGVHYFGTAQSTPLSNPEQMVNGLLIQLKFESEVCPWPLRVMLVLCALSMITTSSLLFALSWKMSIEDVIISTLVICLSCFIILLEGRFSFVSNNPRGCRTSVRGSIIKNIGGFKLVWGRGVFYLLTGLLQVAQMHIMTCVSGGLMALIGCVVIIAGASSAAQLMRLKKSLTDDAHLLYLFAKYDRDKDGYQVIKDFARFIVGVGLDVDDAYTVGAFKAIDKDCDGRISFIDFHKWWAQCSVRGNHVFRMKEQEISNYTSNIGSW